MENCAYIIAEIGINHEGSLDACKSMIEAAARCNVDAVKLQTVDAEENYVKGTESYNIFKCAELTQEETSKAFDYARECNLEIFTTAGDANTVNWVNKLNPSHWKISSGLLTHIPIIEHIASLGKPLLLSTGMSDAREIGLAIEVAKSNGAVDITLLQCTSIYPTPTSEINLSAIGWLKEKYGLPVGFSDHSDGDDAVFLSIAAGASVIEKHFSLDVNRSGFDHRVSLDEAGMKKMVERVRLAEAIMGDKEKKISKEVKVARGRFLRYIVATAAIQEGELFTKKNVGVKRTFPGCSGIRPEDIDNILGRVSDRVYKIDDIILAH